MLAERHLERPDRRSLPLDQDRDLLPVGFMPLLDDPGLEGVVVVEDPVLDDGPLVPGLGRSVVGGAAAGVGRGVVAIVEGVELRAAGRAHGRRVRGIAGTARRRARYRTVK